MDAMEAMEYRRTFTIRQEETVRFQQAEGLRRSRRGILLCMVLVTIAARLIVEKMYNPPSVRAVLIACTIGLVLGLAIPYFALQLIIAYNVSRAYQSGRAKEHIVDVFVNPGGIYLTDDSNEVRVYYDKMRLIRETAADFFIYPDKETAFLIPKHEMEDVKGESDQLRHMFRMYAPSDKLDLLRK